MDGQDVRAVHEAAQDLVERARRGEGPAFLLCNTYRFYGHHVGDVDRSYYRSKEEEGEWKNEHDPITLLAEWLEIEYAVTASNKFTRKQGTKLRLGPILDCKRLIRRQAR